MSTEIDCAKNELCHCGFVHDDPKHSAQLCIDRSCRRIAELEAKLKGATDYASKVGKVLLDEQTETYAEMEVSMAAGKLVAALFDDPEDAFVVSTCRAFSQVGDGPEELLSFDLIIQQSGEQTYEENLIALKERNAELEAKLSSLRNEPELHYGCKIERRSSGMYPQLAGWWACPVEDDDHDHCSGPNDTKQEAIECAKYARNRANAARTEGGG